MQSIRESDIARLEKKASQAAAMLRSMSNKWRLLILCRLLKGEMSVGELLDVVALSQSALSQHLAVLRATKLVSTRRESQTIYYSIKGEEAPKILAALYEVYCAEPTSARKPRSTKPKAA
jgi:DNA-binding transcriptional ArsR family regulator